MLRRLPEAAPDAMPPPDARADPRPAWGLLVFLTGLNVLNFVDRTLIASLAPLLIADLGLTREQIGLLAGFAFVLLYSVFGLLLGLAADRWPRLPLIAGGLALWSAMTAVSGWARGFLSLALPRLFVGIGEATLTPAALSLLGDSFPRRRLGLASGIYYAGIPLGTAASLIAAGFVAPRWGWRACFWLLGGLGLVALALFGFLREPVRRAEDPAAGPRPGLGELARGVGVALRRRPALALVLGGGVMLVWGSASAIHTVTWLVEERGFEFSRAAYLSGLVAVGAGLLGNLAAGAFTDALARRHPQGRPWSLAAMALFFAPAGAAFYLLPPGSPLFYASWFLASAGTTAWFGPLFALVQELAPERIRSTTIAFGLLALNVLGVGPGSWLAGRLGDRLDLTTGLLLGLAVATASAAPFALAARQLARESRGGVLASDRF